MFMHPVLRSLSPVTHPETQMRTLTNTEKRTARIALLVHDLNAGLQVHTYDARARCIGICGELLEHLKAESAYERQRPGPAEEGTLP